MRQILTHAHTGMYHPFAHTPTRYSLVSSSAQVRDKVISRTFTLLGEFFDVHRDSIAFPVSFLAVTECSLPCTLTCMHPYTHIHNDALTCMPIHSRPPTPAHLRCSLVKILLMKVIFTTRPPVPQELSHIPITMLRQFSKNSGAAEWRHASQHLIKVLRRRSENIERKRRNCDFGHSKNFIFAIHYSQINIYTYPRSFHNTYIMTSSKPK